MCEICRKNPCDARCPNADEMKPIAKCNICNDDIYAGDDYLGLDCERYHLDCLAQLGVRGLFDLIGQEYSEVYDEIC